MEILFFPGTKDFRKSITPSTPIYICINPLFALFLWSSFNPWRFYHIFFRKQIHTSKSLSCLLSLGLDCQPLYPPWTFHFLWPTICLKKLIFFFYKKHRLESAKCVWDIWNPFFEEIKHSAHSNEFIQNLNREWILPTWCLTVRRWKVTFRKGKDHLPTILVQNSE